jgi:hypothetical protein
VGFPIPSFSSDPYLPSRPITCAHITPPIHLLCMHGLFSLLPLPRGAYSCTLLPYPQAPSLRKFCRTIPLSFIDHQEDPRASSPFPHPYPPSLSREPSIDFVSTVYLDELRCGPTQESVTFRNIVSSKSEVEEGNLRRMHGGT